MLSGGEVFYLDVLESERSLRMQSSIGATDALHSTSLGKVFLAFSPPSGVSCLIPKTLPRCTANTITDRVALVEQLAIIRTTGYAIEIGENEEGSTASPPRSATAANAAVAAMSLSAPISRYDEGARQAICAGLIAATNEVGRILRGEVGEAGADAKAAA